MREMKDSGIEWIGIIPASWELYRGKHMFTQRNLRGNTIKLQLLSPTQKYGVIPQSVYEERSGMNAVKLNENANLSTLKTIHKGDFCISLRSFQGGFEYSEYEGVVSPAYQVFYPVAKVARGYYKYLFKECGFIEKINSYTMTLRDGKNIAFADFGNTYIPCPPVDEQQRIANFLDAKCAEIDALTADIQTQIDTLEQYKRSVITETVTKGLNPDAEMKDSGNQYWGKIPINWYLSDIKYLFEIVKRIAGKEGYDILSVTQKGIKIKDISNNEGQVAESYANYQFVYPGDFVMNHMDLLTGWVDCSKLFGVTSPDYRVFKLRNKNNSLNYYKYIMQTCYMNRIFYSLGQGVSYLGRWRLQTSSFNNFMVPVPPVEVQESIANYLDKKCTEIDACIDDKQRQLEILAEYKKTLIFEYVTGKKEV